jgi:hypothetical protein
MTMQEQEYIKQKGYAEAMRYMANAKEALSKTDIDGKFYSDAKYVRGASGIAYSGVLVALDALAEIKKISAPKKDSRKNIDFYRDVLSYSQKQQKTLDIVYRYLHLGGYYDGNLDSDLIKLGFKNAKELINLIRPEGEAAL